jgi:membrane-bound lytic murein transglycosylase F
LNVLLIYCILLNLFIDRCLTKTVDLKKVIFVSLFSIVGLILCTIFSHKLYISWETGTKKPESKSKLEEVLSNNELRVVLDFNTTDYFVYKGEPAGFQYELLSAFCKEKNIQLKIFDNNDIDNSLRGLLNNDYDLVAKNIIPEYFKNDQVDYTEPLVLSNLVLVQRLPGNGIKTTDNGQTTGLVKHRFELKGKKVYVSKNSVFANYLKHMSDELGGGLTIVEDSLNSTEKLINLVSKNEIDYTVCNESTASALKQYYKNIDCTTPLCLDNKFSWAITKKSSEWKNYLNDWIINFKGTSNYDEIYEKYFLCKSDKMYRDRGFNSLIGGKLSVYDDVIKEVAAPYLWDWRLISSIIFQESNFDPLAQSIMGATGLMQLMPITVEIYNVKDPTKPRENIKGGIAYLTYLDEIFEPIISDKIERLKFVLASYNIGVGHVMDARRLAMKYNRNPSVWKDNVDYFLMKKSVPSFYNDPVVKWGYCRGEESLNFVSVILDHYHHYLNILPSNEKIQIAAL